MPGIGHGVVDEPRQLFDRHVVGRDREIGDRLRRCFGLEHLRFENAFGQFAAHPVDRVLHFVDRGVDVLADLELDLGGGHAFLGGRGDRIDPGDRADARFDFLGDLVLDFGRRRAWLRNRDDHHRKFDVGGVLDFHPQERKHPDDRQAQEQDDRYDRIADRPGRQVAEIHRGRPFRAISAPARRRMDARCGRARGVPCRPD
jgi:hypothetical protein